MIDYAPACFIAVSPVVDLPPNVSQIRRKLAPLHHLRNEKANGKSIAHGLP
jgi:hypothetical protein